MYKQVFDLDHRPLPDDPAALRADVRRTPARLTGSRRSSEEPWPASRWASRRHAGIEELSALLECRGARAVSAPAIRLVPGRHPGAAGEVATRAMLSRPVDDVVVTTAIGLRAWLETADGWAPSDLIKVLGDARVLARGGPKARGWSTRGRADRDLVPGVRAVRSVLHLLEEDLTGRRIAVQLYGRARPGADRRALRAGAEALEIPVPVGVTEDTEPLRRLVGQAVAGMVDAITFTSAPAVAATLSVAAEHDTEESLIHALRTWWSPRASDRVTAARLSRDADRTPDRARIGALVRALAADLPVRRSGLDRGPWAHHGGPAARRCSTAGCGRSPALRWPSCVRLRPAWARRVPYRPVRVLPSGSPSGSRFQPDEHAVEMAAARLRRGLATSTSSRRWSSAATGSPSPWDAVTLLAVGHGTRDLDGWRRSVRSWTGSASRVPG